MLASQRPRRALPPPLIGLLCLGLAMGSARPSAAQTNGANGSGEIRSGSYVPPTAAGNAGNDESVTEGTGGSSTGNGGTGGSGSGGTAGGAGGGNTGARGNRGGSNGGGGAGGNGAGGLANGAGGGAVANGTGGSAVANGAGGSDDGASCVSGPGPAECQDRCPAFDTCTLLGARGSIDHLYFRVDDQHFDCNVLDCNAAAQQLNDYCCERGAFAPAQDGGSGCSLPSGVLALGGSEGALGLGACCTLLGAALWRRRRVSLERRRRGAIEK
jgi:hypothetical protein